MLWILVFLGLVSAGLFSGAETAFIACPRLRIRHLARSGILRAQRLEKAMSNPGPYLSTLLVGTNLSIIGGTVVATRLAEQYFPGNGETVATVVMTPLFVVFSEILPKSYFLAYARTLCLWIAEPLFLFRLLFSPLIVLVSAPSRLIGFSGERHMLPVSREELILLARLGRKQARLSGAVSELLKRQIASTRPVAREIMRPVNEIVTLPRDATVENVTPTIEAQTFSRYPLVHKDRWCGLVHVIDIVGSPPSTELRRLAQPVPSVADSAPLETIIAIMRTAGEHMILVKEDGRVVGMLTLDDVVGRLTDGLESREDH